MLSCGSNDGFYRRKIASAIYFAERILPRSEALATSVCAGSQSTMALAPDEL